MSTKHLIFIGEVSKTLINHENTKNTKWKGKNQKQSPKTPIQILFTMKDTKITKWKGKNPKQNQKAQTKKPIYH